MMEKKSLWGIMISICLIVLGLSQICRADSSVIYYSGTGHYYQRVDTHMLWPDAKAYCENHGGYLATITSMTENDFIFTSLGNDTMWLGGYAKSQSPFVWAWVTGEAWSFTNWVPPNPNPGQIYLDMWGGYNGHWDNDGPPDFPSRTFAFVCEWDGSNYLDVTTIPDVNGDGVLDLAVLTLYSGKYYLKTIDGATGKLLKQVALGTTTTITPRALTAVATQISVLITKSTGVSVLQLRDNTTLAIVKTLTLPK